MGATYQGSTAPSGVAAWVGSGPAYEGANASDAFLGIVDRLAATPVAAWSLNRALRKAWVKQPISLLRRSSDNDMLQIISDNNGKADYSLYFDWAGPDEVYCARIYDQSGNMSDMVQNAAGSQPRFILTADAVPTASVSTDGSTPRSMIVSAGSSIDHMWFNGGSAYVVMSCGSSGSISLKSNQIRVMGSEGASAGRVRPGFYYGWSASSAGSAFWRSNDPGPVAENAKFTWAVEYEASLSRAPSGYINNISCPLTTVRPPVGVGENDDGAITMFSYGVAGMHIFEQVYFSTLLSSDDRTLLTESMIHRYIE